MAKRKSSKSKSTGLGLGLDALIKAKTKPVEERDADGGTDLILESDEELEVSVTKKEDVPETPKKRTRKSKKSPSKKSKTPQKSAASESTKKSTKKDSSVSSADSQRVEAVLTEVRKNPRISLWSARSAAVLRYLKKTQPEFSISNEASKLIEEAVKEKYPEIWDIFDDI